MAKTLLEIYKKAWSYQDDGETVLEAASRGFFPKNHDKKGPIPYEKLLMTLGIKAEMNRDGIARVLADRMGEDSRFHEVAGKKLRETIPENVTVLPGVSNPDFDQETISHEIREEIFLVLGSVFSFCESEVENDKEKAIKKSIEKKKGILKQIFSRLFS